MKPACCPESDSPELGLSLADGRRWAIRALDGQAEATVRELGKVMQLGPAQGGRALWAASGWRGAHGKHGPDKRRLTCRLGPTRNRCTEVLRMERIATAIAEQSLARKGILLHGALAVREGVGFVLAGPSGVGKSTASRRLSAPWQSLSDDCALVVQDAEGRYWAHPWPTWSLLREDRSVASWSVEQAVPLKAMLFLVQSPSDRAEPVATTPAAGLIMGSAVHLARAVVFTTDGKTSCAICRRYLRAAWALAAEVPAFRLHVSLTGQFWHEIERVLPSARAGAAAKPGNAVRGRTARPVSANPGLLDVPVQPGVAGAAAPIGRPHAARGEPDDRLVCPRPVNRLLAKGQMPRLVCFRARNRTFLKLVVGRRVVGSANDVMREWQVHGPFRRLTDQCSIQWC